MTYPENNVFVVQPVALGTCDEELAYSTNPVKAETPQTTKWNSCWYFYQLQTNSQATLHQKAQKEYPASKGKCKDGVLRITDPDNPSFVYKK